MPGPTKGELATTFRDPPPEYGPIDGWWWEAGRLDRDKMRWQLQELKDKGVSGTWFYARFLYGEPLGSDPGYFSDGWWDFTKFAAEEHRRLGLIDWFSNWTALEFEQDAIRAQRETNPELWGRKLVLHRAEADDDGVVALEIDPADEILDAAAYRTDGDTLEHASRIDLTDSVDGQFLEWKAPGPGWLATVVAARPWDLDYLNPEIGRRWTEVILAKYERHLPGLLGDVVQAFGPDELSLLRGITTYSPSVLERVRSERGYDPTPYLVGLFLDIGPKTEQVRANYHEGVTALLDENFYQAPTAWLHDRGMLHVSLSQMNDSAIMTTYHYGDFFRYLRSFDAPGNEDPLVTGPGERRLFRTKLSSSVAHLYGRQRVVLLAHYATGWGHTLEENLGWTNESYAKGLNLYSRHLGSYSLMGGWYEYVPPSDHFYHPYWRYWRTFADYVRRLSYLMSQGLHRADAAILYPLTTIHAHWIALPGTAEAEVKGEQETPFELEEPEKYFQSAAFEASSGVEEVATAIYHDGIDFDFVDDPSFDRAVVRGDVLEIAGLEFRSVVLPPMTTIRRSTMAKLKEFHDAGGTIVAFGRLPTASAEAGRDDSELKSLIDAVFGSGGPRGVYVRDDASGVAKAISEAIERDVVASDDWVFHTHQKVGHLDVYLLFNARAEARDLTVDLRVHGRPEVWDAFSGGTRPVHRVTHESGRTQVRLRMEPSSAVVLVFAPDEPGPAVLDDDLLEVTGVERDGDSPVVHGLADASGRKQARVVLEGVEHVVEAEVDPLPEPIEVEGPFSFRLEPTMDNRWGDFRYPASDDVVGAEARRFRYREETDRHGTELGWHAPDFDDADWPQVTYSYGPYWWHLGPFPPDSEPDGLLERASRGDPGLDWERYGFSKRFGSDRQIEYRGFLGWFRHLLGVSDNFLVLDEGAAGGSDADHHHYLFTTVHALEAGFYQLRVGRTLNHPELSGLSQDEWIPYRVPVGTQAWIGGENVPFVTEEDGTEATVEVRLEEGANPVLLRVVHPEGMHQSSYALFLDSEPEEQDRYAPVLKWFTSPQRLVYDIKPDEASHVGWYRFTAPPGVRQFSLHTQARGIEAWVDGERVPVEDGTITLDRPRRSVSQVALRVEQEPGTYAGAVFTEPVAFRCEQGEIELGDWSGSGMATYSGIGVYGMEVDLDAALPRNRVVLDLGHVKTVADVSVNGRPAGVGIARPFRFDITDLVQAGRNRIEVKVANTLANHMSTYPTRWVFEGQTVSGLLGPVRVRFLAPVRLVAGGAT